MKNSLSLLGAALVTTLLATGCAGPERKLGRGFNNVYEIVRGGEMRRTVEQTALFRTPDEAYTTGHVRGFNRTMVRTLTGVFEIATFPIPDHGWSNGRADYGPTIKPEYSVYPDNYKPRLRADALFATDTAIGFSGGDVAPKFPGSRFHIFDN